MGMHFTNNSTYYISKGRSFFKSLAGKPSSTFKSADVLNGPSTKFVASYVAATYVPRSGMGSDRERNAGLHQNASDHQLEWSGVLGPGIEIGRTTAGRCKQWTVRIKLVTARYRG